MGIRGRVPLPTKLHILNGNPSNRPLNMNEPRFTAGVPDPPDTLSEGAKRHWERLIEEMAASGVLRRVDSGALAMLCEDVAMLDELRAGLADQTREITQKAAKMGQKLVGNALSMLARTTDGRRTLCSMRELAAQIIIQRREFGLTPAASSRIQAMGSGDIAFSDPLEKALCG